MKKIISCLALTLLLISCSSIYQEQDLCGDFVIKTESDIKSNPIHFVRIKEGLSKKLDLIKSKNSKNICTIVINEKTTTYPEFSSESGIMAGSNTKSEIDIKMLIDNKEIFSDKSGIFYYRDTISHRYSNYNMNPKQNMNISEDLFKAIKTNIDKLTRD